MPGWFWKYVPYFPTDLGAEIFGSHFICVLLSLRHRLEGRNCLLSPLTEALTTQISPIPASAASSPSTMGLPSPSFTPPPGLPKQTSELLPFAQKLPGIASMPQTMPKALWFQGFQGSVWKNRTHPMEGSPPPSSTPHRCCRRASGPLWRIWFASMHPHIEWNYFNVARKISSTF